MKNTASNVPLSRFHGAFTGGFSAGYNNTVGSSEGFQPKSFVSSRTNRQIVSHSIVDYLDEEDGILGGQMKLNQEADSFQNQSKAVLNQNEIPSKSDVFIKEITVVHTSSIGKKILSKYGWKPGVGVGPRIKSSMTKRLTDLSESVGTITSALPYSAIVDNEITFAPNNNSIAIPSIKDDMLGLGYQSQSFGQSLGFEFSDEHDVHPKNVYRVKDLYTKSQGSSVLQRIGLGINSKKLMKSDESAGRSTDKQGRSVKNHPNTSNTYKDDDDDDVYDTGEGHQTYDYFDATDPHEEIDQRKQSDGNDSLSQWIEGPSRPSSEMYPSDGTPVLVGFHLGRSTTQQPSPVHYRPIELPPNYFPRPVFKFNADPPTTTTTTTTTLATDGLPRMVTPSTTTSRPQLMPGGTASHTAFSGISEAFKNRFTPSSSASIVASHPSSSSSNTTMSNSHNKSSMTLLSDYQEGQVHRSSGGQKTIQPSLEVSRGQSRVSMGWTPANLLCKRFNVKVPDTSSNPLPAVSSHGKAASSGGMSSDPIQQLMQGTATMIGKERSKTVEMMELVKAEQNLKLLEDVYVSLAGASRPPLEVFKSIFESDSDSDEEEGAGNDEEGERETMPLGSMGVDGNVVKDVGTGDIPVALPVGGAHGPPVEGGGVPPTAKIQFVPKDKRFSKSNPANSSTGNRSMACKSRLQERKNPIRLMSFGMDNDDNDDDDEEMETKLDRHKTWMDEESTKSLMKKERDMDGNHLPDFKRRKQVGNVRKPMEFD